MLANETGKQYLVNAMPGRTEPDEVLSNQFGYTSDGRYLQSDIDVEAFGQDILDSIEFGPTISATLLPSTTGFSQFNLGSPNVTNFTGNINAIYVTGSDVPEPASLAIFAIGFAGLVSLRRNHAS